jgi:type I restriction enzyme S subunit
MELMETTATADEIRRFGLRVGDVVITKDSEEWSDIAVPALVKKTAPDLVCGYHLAIIRSHPKALFGDYLLRAFQSCAVNQQFQVAASGVTRYGLPKASIGDAWIPLPDVPEQRAIAAFLDRETGRVDRLVAKKRELIERLKEKRTALISRTVTRGLPPAAARAAGLPEDPPLKPSGVAWLDDVPVHWEVSKLKYIKASIPNAFVDGPFGSNLKTEHFVSDGDVFVIESGFATRGEMNEENLKTIEMEHFQTICRSATSSGDIIIAKIGANFGLNHILPRLTKPAVVSGNSLKLTIHPKSCTAAYFHYQLLHLKWCGAIDLLANITAQPALSLGGMNTLSCVRPPLPEQAAIAAYLDLETAKLDALVGKVEEAVERLQEYRTALITAAVTGKIDVRNAKVSG